MGYERFYNSLLVGMGNVVSAILMYALQAAWLCQRLIDQDYRQNHGSRLRPILDNKHMTEPVEIVTSNVGAPRISKIKSTKSKTKKLETDSSRAHRPKSRRNCHRSKARTESSDRRLNNSHPYLEGPNSLMTTVQYVNGLGQNFGLRRAFSDINISSNYSQFNDKFYDNNQNYLSNGNIDETTVAVADQDFLRLIFTKGYVT